MKKYFGMQLLFFFAGIVLASVMQCSVAIFPCRPCGDISKIPLFRFAAIGMENTIDSGFTTAFLRHLSQRVGK